MKLIKERERQSGTILKESAYLEEKVFESEIDVLRMYFSTDHQPVSFSFPFTSSVFHLESRGEKGEVKVRR